MRSLSKTKESFLDDQRDTLLCSFLIWPHKEENHRCHHESVLNEKLKSLQQKEQSSVMKMGCWWLPVSQQQPECVR